ncbi:MAG: HIT family protein [Candidatus Micrarchaeia archaeon]
MSDCIFCKILEGKAEGNILYEDEKCAIILDKFPISKGHMLVISRNHYPDVLSMPDEITSHMFLKAKEFAIKAKEKLHAIGINISSNIGAQAGQIVGHAHIHVIPRYAGEKRNFNFGRNHELDFDDAKELASILGK